MRRATKEWSPRRTLVLVLVDDMEKLFGMQERLFSAGVYEWPDSSYEPSEEELNDWVEMMKHEDYEVDRTEQYPAAHEAMRAGARLAKSRGYKVLDVWSLY